MKFYKIRRKSDGLFSSGSNYIYFTEKGKSWNSASALSSHIAMIYKSAILKHRSKIVGFDLSKIPKDHPYHDCEIVEAEVTFHSKLSVDNFADNRWNGMLKPEQAVV